MNNKYTLKELADMFVYERRRALKNCQSIEEARLLALRHVLDAIGYESPKDAEREAFDAWCNANHKLATTDQFEAWKAGREELRKEVCSDHCEDTKTEPAWIPWDGGFKSPINGLQTRCEIQCRDGTRVINDHNMFRWIHINTPNDIIAYRILEP